MASLIKQFSDHPGVCPTPNVIEITELDSVHCQGQAVYVHNINDEWLAAIVVDVDNRRQRVTAQMETTKQLETFALNDVLIRSEQSLENCKNLTQVTPIHEASVLCCLHERFQREHYYTNAGTTVVAVNPFHDVHHLYSVQQINAYHNRLQDLSPHIYTVAETAYANLVHELGSENQSIVISGVSGAGKTESTKHLLRYLTVVSNPSVLKDEASLTYHTGVKIEQRILDSNPILEAFGNAATPRNNNSSRFGKFIELQFYRMGQIKGCTIQTYLLEKTRVVHQGVGENNFHIFYQMTGMSARDKRYPSWLHEIHSEIAETQFSCVPLNQDCSENGDIMETLDAMTDIGLSQEKQQQVFEILLSILHLCNLRFLQVTEETSDLECSLDISGDWQSIYDSYVEMSDSVDDTYLYLSVTEKALECSCSLLGLSSSLLRQTLLHRCIQPGGRSRQSVFVKPITIAEARSRRDCLAMLLYSRLFDWLVNFINHQIKSDSHDSTIGLLDIYGFETFDCNSLEQLCINYANERLQHHYVTHFLQHLQTEYEEECVQWVPIQFPDNHPCVEILDGKTSVFSVLNEEVYLNRKSNDEMLKERLLKLSSDASYLRPARQSSPSNPSFIVQHFAGDVKYAVSDLVTKNKDDIPTDLITLLLASDNSFVRDLFADFHFPDSPGKKKKTVLTKFKSSLDDLMSTLVTSDAHYIRCLKPNKENMSGVFQRTYVLSQLRACGTIETVNICRRGYPARMLYSEFLQRYSIILRSVDGVPPVELGALESEENQKENICDGLESLLQQQLDLPNQNKFTPKKKLRRRTGQTKSDHARKVCATVLQAVIGDQAGTINLCQQFGRTKIFLLENQLEQLERSRVEAISLHVVKLQAAWRCFVCHRTFKLHQAAMKIWQAWAMSKARREFKHYQAACKIWRMWTTFVARREFLSQKQRIIALQRFVRQWLHDRQMAESLTGNTDLAKDTMDSSSCSENTSLYASTITADPDLNIDLFPVASAVSSSTTTNSQNRQSQANTDTQSEFFESDLSSNLSDDSGVIVNEPVHCRKTLRAQKEVWHESQKEMKEALEPPQKRKRQVILSAKYPKLQGMYVGDGIISRRRILKHCIRFHIRATVLKYSHLVNRRDLPCGLPDILPSRSEPWQKNHDVILSLSSSV